MGGYEIPTEGRIPLLDITIPIHWGGNHAILMFAIWFVLVPFAVILLRFGKIRPTPYGIPRGTPKWAWPELPWSFHKYALYTAIALALAGGAGFAMMLSGGFSGTLHAWFGLATILLGGLGGQGASAWFRGSHGGRKGPPASDPPEDRTTWGGGDHFDMAPQRWWFEAYHKTSGYFACFVRAGGPLAPVWRNTGCQVSRWPSGGVVLVGLIASVLLQGRGHNHDTYSSVYGYHPEHPFNKRRYREMIKAQDMEP